MWGQMWGQCVPACLPSINPRLPSSYKSRLLSTSNWSIAPITPAS